MKLLLVVASEATYNLISYFIKPLGLEPIRYRQALKAMDNIDEVDPDGVIISAEDFPRHWKTLVQFIRSERPKDKTAIVILKGPHFPFEEAAKASYIGVNGIVSENLDDPEEQDRLQGILSRYIPVEAKRGAKRIRPNAWDSLGLIFSHPKDGKLITGTVETLSLTGLSFLPDQGRWLENLYLETPIPQTSLRVGDQVLSPLCSIARTGRIISLHFDSFPPGEQGILEKYLLERPLLERKRQASQGQL